MWLRGQRNPQIFKPSLGKHFVSSHFYVIDVVFIAKEEEHVRKNFLWGC